MAVLEAVADHQNVETTDLETPLYTAIDPDALERVMEGGEGVTVVFEYAGHTVHVRGDGCVGIDCESNLRGAVQ